MALGGIGSMISNSVSSLLGGPGQAGRRNDNIFDLSQSFTPANSSMSSYFSVEPFLQSLAANPLMGTSVKNLSGNQLGQVTQLTQNLLGGNLGGLEGLAAGLNLGGNNAGNAGNAARNNQAAPAQNNNNNNQAAPAQNNNNNNQAAPAQNNNNNNQAAPAQNNNNNNQAAPAAETPEKPAEPKPETPLSKLLKAMMSGTQEIQITRGELTQALSLGQVADPDEELTLSARDAMVLVQSSPLSKLAGGLASATKTADPLAGLGALAGGSGANPLAGLMGGASGGNILSTMMASMGSGKSTTPSLSELFDLPTLGKADSIIKLSGLGSAGVEA